MEGDEPAGKGEPDWCYKIDKLLLSLQLLQLMHAAIDKRLQPATGGGGGGNVAGRRGGSVS